MSPWDCSRYIHSRVRSVDRERGSHRAFGAEVRMECCCMTEKESGLGLAE